ncbi:MAG: hypothetical protein HY211_04680 [Candidatus Omnitrophica bacterium]|nr:hypothetical protein [Candidatus Omnitrophota bacterium]
MIRLRTFFWIVACAIALGALGLLLGLRSYQVFTQEELVAVVRCQAPSNRSTDEFLLEFTPVTDGIRGSSRKLPIRGDQWMVGGDILKWHPWLNWIGFKNCHKLTRINSRYLKIEAERERPKSAYELNGGTSPLWLFLYRFGRCIPFVEAVYGNASYTMAQPGSQWGVYVTLSGYLVKPLR